MSDRPAAAQPASTAGLPRRVLVIEDEALIALETCSHLADWGYDVCGVAASSQEAIQAARRTPPHIALVDLTLKDGEDGVTVATRLRELCGAAVVFLTGNNDDRSRRRMLEINPAACLFKPYRPADLRSAVDTAIG